MTMAFGGEAEGPLAPDGAHGGSRAANGKSQGGEPRTRALTLLRHTFERIGGANAVERRAAAPAWLDELYDSVLGARTGHADASGLATAPAATLLERVRSEFLTSARRDDTLDSREALDLVAALDRVASDIRHAREQDLGAFFEQVGSHEAVVEVAHDMRSPLNAIMMLVRLVLDGRELRPETAQQLGIVYSAAFGLNALVNDLVDSAQPEAGLLEPAPVAMSIAEVLRSVHDIVAPVAAEKGLLLRIGPSAATQRLGHPAAVHRVLLNLVTNALKYTDHGSVSVGTRELPYDRVEFTVVDTGRGMSRSQLARVFTPFRPRPLARREQSFSSGGLGLALCRSLVQSMNGRILVDSVEGRGTTFRVELEMPRAEQELTRILPPPWRDELAGDVATAPGGIVLGDRPLRIPQRAD